MNIYLEKSFAKAIRLGAIIILLAPFSALQAKGGGAPPHSSLNDPFVLLLIAVMAMLLLVIIVLARLVIGSAAEFFKKERASQPSASTAVAAVIFCLVMLSGLASNAQEPAITPVSTVKTNLSIASYWFLAGVIGIELLVILALLYYLKVFLKKSQPAELAVEKVEHVQQLRQRIPLWTRLNRFKPISQEADLDLGHNYDGIKELDNRLPPWWLYGFYISIAFAVVYLWRFHVSHTGLSSEQEFRLAMKEADVQKEQYLKNAANNVDENTVKLVNDITVISSGKTIFLQNCSPCHGKDGEGVVGPNLTDDYWMHGGSIKDIFKTIKYGWPEKGMKSWKDDLSSSQISELSNFIKSIHGSHPQNAKEQQGEVYTENDSLVAKPPDAKPPHQ